MKQLIRLKQQFYLYGYSRETLLVKFRTIKSKDLGATPELGATVELSQIKNESLDDIIAKLVQKAEEAKAKEQAEQDALALKEQELEQLRSIIDEQKHELGQLQIALRTVEAIKTSLTINGDGEKAKHELKQVVEENQRLKKANHHLTQQLASLQEQYNLLAVEVEDSRKVAKFKEKFEQQLTALLEVVKSFDPKP